jgi:putative ABC transport system permease protein
MLRNYIKIAIRNLLRHKAFSFINIAGLSIGMACSVLILLWVSDELSYDKFHNDSRSLFRITANLSDINIRAAVTSAPLAIAIKNEIPQIESTVRTTGISTELLQVEEKMFEERRVLFADSNFLQFFTFPLVAGNPATALQKPESILITEAMAKKYFGEANALGKTIRRNHKIDFTVTGILANVPENSHLKFDFVIPIAIIGRDNDDFKNNIWDNFNYSTYVKVHKSALAPVELKKLEDRFLKIYKAHEPRLKVGFELQPITRIHLHSEFIADVPGHGNIQYVYIFIVVAVFILVVACINFMNLATARSARRAKEVGLRKVAGALRFQLIRQFLAESSFIAILALALAIIIVATVLPAFNDLAEKNLRLNINNTKIVIGLLSITIVTGLLAGSYPALFLSGFAPVKVLKGSLRSGAASSLFRNVMVVTQFSVSIILLVGTAIIYSQLKFIQSKNLGFDKENLIYAPMTGELWNKYQVLKNSLEQNQLTSKYTVVSDLPTNISNGTVNVKWEGKDPDTQPLFPHIAVDENFIDVFGITLLSGRGFSKEFRADTSNYVLNEKALSVMGMDVSTAVGQKLSLWDKQGTIIGVVKDFNFKPIQKSIEPLILRLNTFGGFAVVRSKPGQIAATSEAMEKVFKELNPEYPFSYNFFDQEVANQYKAEQQLSKLFTVFASLAIFISCLGLYGLSAFLAERRTKEIGVRKVLGASDFHVVYLLSKTFTKPIVLAMVIASPIAWFVMDRWLQGFAYHVTIHWGIFVVAFVAAITIAWLTVSYESIRATLINPAESLRNE